ncbi:hemolysin family protein [Flavisolibacter ginsengisoli]|jgi:putative hemolysin|uniref:Hemolysin, contains CBS domains n=1 Tax=Flavisolibacter ginsengisoli DSM 18119 TaxID=1121884 RepID=A0A1M5C8G7_9BACT|nr:hemolysin family protein [Flavisolibacter ginsengisoli]SHF51049.1 Hemolysin, contains CBS domains [Flavisolibacter ginsengisoli DSM 18119]
MIAVTTLVWFFVTIIMMGFFAGVEMAFYSINRFGIELKKKQGRQSAILLSKFIENPQSFLSTTLLGFTLFLVCFALLFTQVTFPLWEFIGLKYDIARLVLDIILATFIVLIFAEFIPRAIFRAQSNWILSRMVWLINFFYQILQPIAMMFLNLSDWVLKYIFNVRIRETKDSLSSGTLETMFQQSNESEYEQEEFNTELFENALELPKVKVRQCLVPRKEIIGVELKCTPEQAREKFIETKLSKLIVYEGNIDNIVGYIHQLDMFKNPNALQSILLPIPAVPESMSATDLIGKFTKERKSIAWVVDEFGGTAGIVTMEDLLEEIFGEIHDEYDSEEFVEKRLAENEYIFSGRLELDYISEKYNLEFAGNESETLSGYIINHHETIPHQKERIIIDDYEFDILSVSDTRIEMVKLKILK